ncbi:nucleotidyltransferase family protein, partial [Peptoniphilus indolicus]|uniref:nucleotidyltransferase family protein n=1 Tax=Peptoniphilus indolicus TaxID=33030 RepID=UPI001575BA96
LKDITKSRIRRLICQIVFDLKREFILESINHPYVRVLGINNNGTDLLNKLKEEEINYITKFSDKNIFSSHIKKIIKKEILVSNTYNMLQNQPLKSRLQKQSIYTTLNKRRIDAY